MSASVGETCTEDHAREALRSLTGADMAALRVAALSGDASTRRYFRVWRGGESQILVLYPEELRPSQGAFLALRARLEEWGLPVPALVAADETRGAVLLGDLGDVTLQERLRVAGADERVALYEQATVWLVRLQQQAAHASRGPGFEAAFDEDKLTFELDFFAEHFMKGLRGVVLEVEDRRVLEEGFRSLAREMASWPRVLCHRDYHSRNLMWHAGQLYWIDFQDARLGPVTYDIASLLRDAYVGLPETLVSERLEAFRRAVGGDEPEEEFQRRFELTCVQRMLKALGTFGHQAAVRGNAGYLEYVPRALAHARRYLLRHPSLGGVHRVLERHLEGYRP